MTQEVVTRIKLDTSSIPGAAAQAGRAIGGIGTTAQASARQTTNAMRQLPAQFTDIATQLAGGQNIGLILLQQGGQIRDAFGSIGGAVRGVASLLTPLNVAFGVAAGAVGLLTVAYRAAGQEQDAITRGLILSGNAAGTTAGQINDLARAQDALVGTRAQAAQVLTQLAASGRVYGAQLAAASEAAVRLALVGGPAIEETGRKFIDLGRSPLQALARINDQENIFTESVVRQVAALTRQGREAEAAAVAQQAYADAIVQRARDVEGSLGPLRKGWADLASFAREAWDAMLDIDRPDTLGQRLDRAAADIADVQAQLARNRARGFGDADPYGLGSPNAGLEGQISALRQRQAELQELQRLERRGADLQRNSADAARRALEEERRRRQGRTSTARDAMGPPTFADQFGRELDSLINDNTIARAADYARTLQSLDDLFFQGVISAERYDAAVVKLTGAKAGGTAASSEFLSAERRLAELMDGTGSAALERQRADMLLLADAFERGRITGEEYIETVQSRLATKPSPFSDEERARRRREQILESGQSRLTDTLADNILSAFDGRFDDIGRRWETLLKEMVAKALAADLASALFGIGTGGNFASVFSKDFSWENLLFQLGGGILGGRAGGGNVNPRSAYLVGEQGPEVLVMGGRGGSIIPNSRLSGGGAVAPVVNITMHIDSRSDAAHVAQTAAQAVRTAQEGMWQQLRSRGLV